MDSADRQLLIESLRSMFTSSADDPATDPAAALDELGWAEAQEADPAEATTLLFTEHGRHAVTSSLLDRVVLAEIGADHTDTAVIYPPFGAGHVTDEGVALADPTSVSSVWVPRESGLARLPSGELDARPVGAFDTGRTWWRVRVPAGLADPASGSASSGSASSGSASSGSASSGSASSGSASSGSGQPPPDAWERAVAAGRRALAAELHGIAEVLLENAVRHTSERVQYGRPIASYQTVRHRLVEAHAVLTASRLVLDEAWADGSPWAAAAAKAVAGSAYRDVARHAMQLCGAVGLTLEHHQHGFVERGALLEELLGSARFLERELGNQLLSGLRAPAVVQL